MNRQTAHRWTNFVLAAAAVSGFAAAQSTTPPSETYGSSCGPNLRTGSSEPGGVTLQVDGATPGAQLVLMLGTSPTDQILPGTSCRLLTMPELAMPLVANAYGSASMLLPLPGVARGLLRGQAIESDGGMVLRTSAGLALHTGPATERQGRVLATVSLGSAEFEFLETSPGEVLVVGFGSGTPPALPTDRFDAVELYEELSRQPAPDALRRAAAAARHSALATAGADPAEPPATGIGRSGGGPGPNACFSSNWFVANFCQGGSGWTFCTVNNHGNPWAESFCSWILGATACNSGSYLFQYRRKDFGVWSTPYSRVVNSCHWYWYGASGAWRTRRMQVILGDGDAKHLSVKGN